MKRGIKVIVVASVLAVSLVVAMFSTVADLGDVNIHFVRANPGEFGDSKIVEVCLWINEPPDLYYVYFTATGQTENVQAGDLLVSLDGSVWIDKTYAEDKALAVANTRVYVTVKNPYAQTEFAGYATTHGEEMVEDGGTYWIVFWTVEPWLYIELTVGTWTIITRYDIYA